MNSEKRLEDLADAGKKALIDYDELLERYNLLLEVHEETKRELTDLQSVVQPMYDEFGEIHTKYHMEKSLRVAAESYATRVVKDNKKIKRQSAMIMAHISAVKPIAIDIDIDDVSSKVEDDRMEELHGTISKLQDEIAHYKVQLEKARDDISVASSMSDIVLAEREEYKLKCSILDKELNGKAVSFLQQKRELNSLKRVSTLAYTDYTSLQEKYDTERVLRLKAEVYAHEQQRKRASLIDSRRNSGNEELSPGIESESLKLLKADNERLHNELSEQEAQYKAEAEELQQQLKDSASHELIVNLEDKLEALNEDLERVNAELETLKHENKHLAESVAKVTRERDQFMNIPVPPPPPPPPGPAAGISRLIIGKKKKSMGKSLDKIVGKDTIKNDSMKGAMEEMMTRIKSGAALRSVDMNSRPNDLSPKEEEGGAMKEMHKYLVSMKQQRENRSIKQTDAAPAIDDELAKKFAIRRERSDSVDIVKKSADTPKIDSELAQKFARHRSNSVDDVAQCQPSATKPPSRLPKQGSLDGPPVPKPKPRRATTKPSTKPYNGLHNELEAVRIPDKDGVNGKSHVVNSEKKYASSEDNELQQ